MIRPKKNYLPKEVLAASSAATNLLAVHAPAAAPDSRLEPLVERAMPHLVAGHYDKALGVLAAGSSPQTQNARGVCLLRAGRVEEAVRLFRCLVLQAGGTWSKPDLPTIYKTNFATALLLAGQPSGCESMLIETRDDAHPSVIRLRQALVRWQSSLNFLHRLNWWFGRLEPPNCRIEIDFPPGDLVDPPRSVPEEGAASMPASSPSWKQW